MTVPLRHFFVALAFLLAAVAAGVGTALGVAPAFAGLAQVHLLPVGWVCVTIMGAMTQFVPVWSGTTLYSRRLANAQLLLVAVGLTGFALSLLAGALPWLAGFGALMLCGFWVFVANVSLTLARVDDDDVTERHFLLALLFSCCLPSSAWCSRSTRRARSSSRSPSATATCSVPTRRSRCSGRS